MNKLETLLEFQLTADKDSDSNDLDRLLRNYHLCQNALDKFIRAEISLDEFCDMVETANVEMDEYLKIVENNLNFIGIF